MNDFGQLDSGPDPLITYCQLWLRQSLPVVIDEACRSLVTFPETTSLSHSFASGLFDSTQETSLPGMAGPNVVGNGFPVDMNSLAYNAIDRNLANTFPGFQSGNDGGQGNWNGF